ncbi:zinc finger, CCHC-type containing protein, partial [Tanacetum coccineum]
VNSRKREVDGSKFLDWYRNLRIVLRNEQKLHHLEEALPEAPPATATAVVRNAYTCRVAEQQEAACLMLAEQELFETVKAFHACKQEEGQSVSTYVLKMKAYLDQMEHLGYPMPLVLGVNMIQKKGIPKKNPTVLAIRQGQIHKPKSQARGKGKQRGKGKSMLAYDSKHKIPPPAKNEHPAKYTECHHCHKTGYWKRNCPLYLAELKKTKPVDLNNRQGLRGYQKLNKGALDLYVVNGNTAELVEAKWEL